MGVNFAGKSKDFDASHNRPPRSPIGRRAACRTSTTGCNSCSPARQSCRAGYWLRPTGELRVVVVSVSLLFRGRFAEFVLAHPVAKQRRGNAQNSGVGIGQVGNRAKVIQ